MKKRIKYSSCTCNNCGNTITFSENEPSIGFKYCGGMPGYSVTIHCRYCGHNSSLPQTRRNKKLLKKRLKSFPFPEAYK